MNLKYICYEKVYDGRSSINDGADSKCAAAL